MNGHNQSCKCDGSKFVTVGVGGGAIVVIATVVHFIDLNLLTRQRNPAFASSRARAETNTNMFIFIGYYNHAEYEEVLNNYRSLWLEREYYHQNSQLADDFQVKPYTFTLEDEDS